MAVGSEVLGGRVSAPFAPLRFLRRSSDIWMAVAMGAIVALLILKLPMPAALASSVVGAFVLLAVVDTRAALLALILVRPAADVTTTIPILSAAGSSSVNANALMSLVVIALGLSHIALNRVQLRRMPLAVPFAAFVACIFLGIAGAPDKNQTAQDFLRILGTFMVFVLCVDAMRLRADRQWLMRILLLSSVVPLLVGAYQFVTDTGDQDKGFNRIQGTFVNPPPYADFLVQLLPLAIVFVMHTPSRLARLALAMMVPVMVFSIYATQTRGAWIGVIIIVMVWLWRRARWSLLLVPLVLGAIYFGAPSVRARIAEATSGTCVSRTYCESSAFWRVKQWQAAAQITSPVKLATFGAGFSAVEVTLGTRTHNEYLRLLVESGLVGFFAIAVLYRRLISLTLKAYRESATPYQRDLAWAFFAVLLSRLVMAASDNILDIVVIEWYFWAFAAVIVLESGTIGQHRRAESSRAARSVAVTGDATSLP